MEQNGIPKELTNEQQNKKEEKLSFIQKLFSCCVPARDDLDNSNFDLVNEKNGLKQAEEEIDESLLVFPKKYIREDEKKIFKFTKEGILEFFNNLEKRPFQSRYEKENLKISVLEKTELYKNQPLVKTTGIISKSLFTKKIPTIPEIGDAFIKEDKRRKWNTANKEYKIIEKISDNADIVYSSTYKIVALISEREMFDKRYAFIQDNKWYSFCTSIPDELNPIKEEPIRITDYIGCTVISEDQNNFYFDSYNQLDIKFDMPTFFLVLTLPFKMKEFFDGLIKFFNNLSEEA